MFLRGIGRVALRRQSALAGSRFSRPAVQHLVSGSEWLRLNSHLLSSSSAQSNEGTSFSFQAETSKLLDIVINSVYSEKEVFLRELVSNSADALEKLRHLQASGAEGVELSENPAQIDITSDKEKGLLIIQDNGVGMSRDELLNNLGTIAKSGSKAFVEARENMTEEVAKNMIGQFGIGFYSAFIVGNEVEVFSKSALGSTGSPTYVWKSTGTDQFTVEEAKSEDALKTSGSKIVIRLKDADKEEYTDPKRIKEVIKQYSNYVGYPIHVNGEKANEVSAIWTRDPSTVEDEEYKAFYRFSSKSFDEPLMRLHFRTDVPIDLKCLIFVPTISMEKLGMERLKPGVSLYSRKVLLEANSERLLPEWLRFVKGVVDSEDLPISLSRETMQDSRLLEKIRHVVVRKIVNMMQAEAQEDEKKYCEKFFRQFGNFIKEGVCRDERNMREIARLLRFSSSRLGDEELTSFDDYISRCEPSQDKIYYLNAPSQRLALQSPYYEVFKEKGIEVLFLYNPIDDFVMNNLGEVNGRKLVSAESGDADLDKDVTKKSETENDDKEEGEEDPKDNASASEDLPSQEVDALKSWMETELSESVKKVSVSTRLKNSPAIVVDHESAALRRMMRMVQQGRDGTDHLEMIPEAHLQINTKHAIIQRVNDMRKSNPELARSIAQQVLDNALIAAGLVDDPRIMLPRLNKLLETLLQEK